jgi:F420-dependent oxidoreductase-like protein
MLGVTRIGLFVDEMGPSLDAVVDQARAAADAGFAGVWVGQRTGRDALTTLAVAGSQVPGVELGTGVVPTYPRHPLALAAQALTVQEAVGGRVTLGVGVSHRPIVEDQFGYSFDRPARHLREYLSALVPLLRGENVTYRGETITAVGAVDLAGVAPPSVLVGALGPAMLLVTGELADGTITTWATAAGLADHVVPRSPARPARARRAWSPPRSSASPRTRTSAGRGSRRTSAWSASCPTTAPCSTGAAQPARRTRSSSVTSAASNAHSGSCSTPARPTWW